MNFRQLEAFIAVVEEQSFSRGAERVLLTQSTVSQHIAALEDEVGMVLLDRSGRRVQATEGGRLLLRYANRLMAMREEAGQALAALKGLERGSLRAGGSNIPAVHLFPQLLQRFRARYPGITVQLEQGDSAEIVREVADGSLDLGIVGTREQEKRVDALELLEDRLVLLLKPDHPLAGRQQVGIEELKGQTLVMREQGSGTRRTLEEALKRSSLAPADLEIGAYLGSNEAVKRAVAMGLGLGFVSHLSVADEVERGELATVTVEGLELRRSFYLVTPRGRHISPTVEAFREMARQWSDEMAAGGNSPAAESE